MIAPQKIEDPNLIKQIDTANQKPGSAWNKAGTWYVILYERLIIAID